MDTNMEVFFRGGQVKHLIDHYFHEICNHYSIKRVDLQILLAINTLGNNLASTDLIHFLHINKGHVSQSILHMKKLKYVEVITDPQDKRYHRIHLTPEGEKLAQMVEQEWIRIKEQVVDGISKEDFDCCLKVINQISNNIDEILSHSKEG